jgi:hypothetical protein
MTVINAHDTQRVDTWALNRAAPASFMSMHRDKRRGTAANVA